MTSLSTARQPAEAAPQLAAAASRPAVGGGGTPAARVQLLAFGRNPLRDGRGFFVLADRAHAERVVAATRAYAGEAAIPIDYDHQSVYAAKDGVGGQAPAAGWIDPAAIEIDEAGIWAAVEWTPAAEARLSAREYRYLSPVVLRDAATGEVLSIVNAALTNSPAIPALAAVASTQEPSMTYAKIAAALGLPETATEDELMAAIAAMKEGAMATAGAELKTASANLETATAALADATARLKAYQDREADELVAAAVEAGKVTPAQKPFWLDQAKRDPAGTRAYLEAAAPIVAPGELVPAAVDPKGGSKLTAEERAVAKQMGVSEEAYLKAKED
jgi:phage I-like protein